ncbi:putative glutamine amidotransferase [Streptomyces albogriseolus]|uniref:Glutamine amidotransferase n=1 Tax=Streptomyces albogriseolus TaxID=1887 RepID=A0ACC6UMJ5_STRAO
MLRSGQGVTDDCEHGVKSPLHMTVAVTDGQQMWAFRYSTAAASGSLYYSTQVETLRALHTDVAFLRDVSDETRLIVSEPLSDLPGVWNEVTELSSAIRNWPAASVSRTIRVFSEPAAFSSRAA